jgi:hypothetical protein
MYLTKRGRCLRLDFPGAKAYGVEWQRTIVASSTRFFGYCAPEHRGAIYRLRMEAGKIPIDVSVAGVMREYGKACWNKLSKSPTLNG